MLLKVARPLARIRAAVITSVVVHLNRTYAYLKLKLLNHLHLDSALCCTSVVQSVLTAHMPETHTRTSKEGSAGNRSAEHHILIHRDGSCYQLGFMAAAVDFNGDTLWSMAKIKTMKTFMEFLFKTLLQINLKIFSD